VEPPAGFGWTTDARMTEVVDGAAPLRAEVNDSAG
jgi:hypothetical protein